MLNHICVDYCYHERDFLSGTPFLFRTLVFNDCVSNGIKQISLAPFLKAGNPTETIGVKTIRILADKYRRPQTTD